MNSATLTLSLRYSDTFGDSRYYSRLGRTHPRTGVANEITGYGRSEYARRYYPDWISGTVFIPPMSGIYAPSPHRKQLGHGSDSTLTEAVKPSAGVRKKYVGCVHTVLVHGDEGQ